MQSCRAWRGLQGVIGALPAPFCSFSALNSTHPTQKETWRSCPGRAFILQYLSTQRAQDAFAGEVQKDFGRRCSANAAVKEADAAAVVLEGPNRKAKIRKANPVLTRDRDALAQLGTEPFDLNKWRFGELDLRWRWGETTAEEVNVPQEADAAKRVQSGKESTFSGRTNSKADTLSKIAVEILGTATPKEKIAMTHLAWRRLREEKLDLGVAEPPDEPARPEKPQRVPPKHLPTAKELGLPLNVYMLLNLAHVELNAIDLAWDTVARFSAAGLPKSFFDDFAHVADDEGRHLGWCLQRLEELGFAYGDMPAHNVLWEGAQKSAGDVIARLVLVPCSQEARGLDAGPRLVERLGSIPDHRSAAIVARISREELAHVAVGTFWFRLITAAAGQESSETFQRWIRSLCPELLGGQFNHPARAKAGLELNWYDGAMWPSELAEGPPQGLKDLNAVQLIQVQRRLTQLLDLEESFS